MLVAPVPGTQHFRILVALCTNLQCWKSHFTSELQNRFFFRFLLIYLFVYWKKVLKSVAFVAFALLYYCFKLLSVFFVLTIPNVDRRGSAWLDLTCPVCTAVTFTVLTQSELWVLLQFCHICFMVLQLVHSINFSCDWQLVYSIVSYWSGLHVKHRSMFASF